MRGKVNQSQEKGKSIRITPAYAGKSKCSRSAVADTRDHPRLCGEKLEHVGKRPARTGSPPPMRGKELTHATLQTSDRITPAYAGKSQHSKIPFPLLWDHPRLCGEK